MKQQVNTNRERVGEVATIYLRGNTWWVNLQYCGRQIRKSLKTRNKKEARAKAIALERELMSGSQPAAPRKKKVTIAEVVVELIQSCEAEDRRPKTITKYRQVLERFVDFAMEENVVELSDVNLRLIDQYRNWRKQQGAKPKTIHNELGVIRRLMLFAKTRRLVSHDPLEGLRLVEPKTDPQPCWTPDEVEVILAKAFPKNRPVYTLLTETGMRIGELQWLTWDDIDFAQKLIHIHPKDGWTTKTGNARSIPMSDRAREVLEKQPRKHRWVFTAAASRRYPNGDHQVSERRLLSSLKRTLTKLGLKGHLHTFRHSFISRAIVGGIPEAIIRSWVGHVDQKTLQHYTHIASAESRAAMERLEQAR